MADVQREASSLVHSTTALRDRATKAGLSAEETQAIIDSNVTSMAQMAFAIAPPGTAPTEQDVRDFYNGRVAVNLGTITSTKLLVFQCHTLVVADIKAEVTKKDDPSSSCSLPSAERERRIAAQRTRLSGLRLKGDEEVAHCSYDLVFTLLEKDTVQYLHPERFITRRTELQKKPPKQLSLDNERLVDCERKACRSCLQYKNRTRARAGAQASSPSLRPRRPSVLRNYELLSRRFASRAYAGGTASGVLPGLRHPGATSRQSRVPAACGAKDGDPTFPASLWARRWRLQMGAAFAGLSTWPQAAQTPGQGANAKEDYMCVQTWGAESLILCQHTRRRDAKLLAHKPL